MNWKEFGHRLVELAGVIALLTFAAVIGFLYKPVLTGFALVCAILLIALYLNLTWESQMHARRRGFPEPRPENYPPLELRVTNITRTLGSGRQIKLLLFEMKGGLTAGKMAYEPQFEVRLTDVTEGKYRPVIAAHEALQERGSSVFELRNPLRRPLTPWATVSSWAPIAQVPVELLGFPFQGKRKVLVELILRNLLDHRVVSLAQCRIKIKSTVPGFIEAAKLEKLAQIETVKLALWLSAIDGNVDDEEVSVIQSWGSRVAKSLEPGKSEARRATLNKALHEATQMIRKHRSTELEADTIKGLGGETPLRLRYAAYELCAQIARADGVADPAEVALLKRIADGLGLDEEKTKLLSDRYLADADLGGLGGEQTESDKLLGITEGMDRDEIRRLLNKHFRKWQGRQASNDATVREKAQQWLDMIAEARNRHLS